MVNSPDTFLGISGVAVLRGPMIYSCGLPQRSGRTLDELSRALFTVP